MLLSVVDLLLLLSSAEENILQGPDEGFSFNAKRRSEKKCSRKNHLITTDCEKGTTCILEAEFLPMNPRQETEATLM